MAISAFLRLMRPQQWIKNLFVAAPLFFNPSLWTMLSITDMALAVVVFCLLSSAVYALNDLLDAPADRLHAEKCRRPVAAGAVTPRAALTGAILLGMGGLALATTLGPAVTGYALAYLGLQIAYCFWLKHRAIIDIMAIAGGFVLRVLAGGAVIGVAVTPWILIITTLLALFQGLAKRRDDLVRALDGQHRRSIAGYNKPFVDAAMTVTLGGLLVAYLIFTTDDAVIARFGTAKLFYTAPWVVAGILRYLQITLVEEKSGAPTEIVLHDRFMIMTLAGWALSFIWVIHARG